MTSPALSMLSRWQRGTLYSLAQIEQGLCSLSCFFPSKEYLSPLLSQQLQNEGLKMSLQLMMNDAWPLDGLLCILCKSQLIWKIPTQRTWAVRDCFKDGFVWWVSSLGGFCCGCQSVFCGGEQLQGLLYTKGKRLDSVHIFLCVLSCEINIFAS